ncbi:MAG: carboxymuconolactone decarboxylase family protein [Rhodospirillales bacterium]|nr:carboxymuconolactone decarboxylase family protein [Rhodospirillales bacterium]
MISRLNLGNFIKLAPATIAGLKAVAEGVKQGSIPSELAELINLRVSQINGCGFCLQMHLKEAAKLGMDESLLLLLPVWRETAVFNDREKAALALAEAITGISQSPVSDQVFLDAQRHFDDTELAHLVSAAVAINGFNRIALTYLFSIPTNA